MSTTSQVAALAQRVAAEFKASRALVGGAPLPSLKVGQTAKILATPATVLPSGVVWDSGGAPDMTGGRRIIDLVFDGISWVGTYSPLIPLAAPGTLSSTILSFTPAGYWKLDETSGTTATDSSGNNRHGTYNGAYTLNARDGAPVFSGGYVEIPDNDDWSVGGSGITLFAIGYISAHTTTNSLFMAKAAPQYEWGMGISWEQTGRASQATWWAPDGADFQSELTPDPHPLNQWNALAVTFGNPSTSGARFPLYRNTGSAQPTVQPDTFTEWAPANGSSVIRIPFASFGQAVQGSVRHVAIFQGQKTAEQIDAIMNAARAEGLIP